MSKNQTPKPPRTEKELRRANLNSAIFIAIPMMLTFFIAIYLIGFKDVQMPLSEYDDVEAARVRQRNTLIGPTLEYLLPKDAAGAANFDATVAAAPTRLRPFLIGTATATAQGTYLITETPRPTSTPRP